MGTRLRGSPSLVGRWIANPVRSAPGGSNPPPRAVDSMRVRSYDEVDPFEVHKLSMAAFGWAFRPEWIRTLTRRDPRYPEDYAVYAVERGRPLAQIVPLTMPVRLTSGVETVGGLQGVCSHPSVWGRGYTRRLIEHVHDRYRGMGLRISTLTTSRNIRGYRVYSSMGYRELVPFYCASRNVPKGRRRPGVRLRRATRRDLPILQELFERHARDLFGWSVRLPEILPARVAWWPKALTRYRVVLRDGRAVGYLRTRPEEDILMEEMVIPRWDDFRAAAALLECRVRGRVATTTWITCRRDQERFRALGYDLDGPIPEATMAAPLDPGVRPRDLPAMFGTRSGRFVHYPTDDF